VAWAAEQAALEEAERKAQEKAAVEANGNGNGNGDGGALPRDDSDDVPAADSAAPPPPPPLLDAEQDTGHTISVERTVHARIEDVWAVLTDYNKLQEFIPNLVRPSTCISPSSLCTPEQPLTPSV